MVRWLNDLHDTIGPHKFRSAGMTNSLATTLARNLQNCLKRRDLTQAKTLLSELRALEPLAVTTRGLELEYLTLSERFTEAEPLAEQLSQLFPQSPRVHFLIGQLAYRQRRYEAAVSGFRESHRLHPSWWTQLWLGKSLTQNGDFQEAERVLTSVVANHPKTRTDLSWLYERQGQHELAIQELQRYLRDFPEDGYAKKQHQRLVSRSLSPEEVVDEVDLLSELGEEVDENILPEYVQGLLQTGRADEARKTVRERAAHLSLSAAVRTAWNCYRLQAYDLAFELFQRALPRNLQNPKFLAAFETSARRINAVPQLIQAYGQHVQNEPRMYGRIRRLSQHKAE